MLRILFVIMLDTKFPVRFFTAPLWLTAALPRLLNTFHSGYFNTHNTSSKLLLHIIHFSQNYLLKNNNNNKYIFKIKSLKNKIGT